MGKMIADKPVFYQEVDGFKTSRSCSPEVFRSALRYQSRPDDVFISTYPKCGTTWMQHIVFLIYNAGKPPKDVRELMTHIPFLELDGRPLANDLGHPTTFKSHLPYHLIPRYPSPARYIFVARNPFDCCVSFYHHTIGMNKDQLTTRPPLTFAEYFEYFIEGHVSYGDYFDHLLSWYDHREDDNVFFTTYEQMKADHRRTVLQVADFLGAEYGRRLRSDPHVLEDVVRFSGFDYMKQTTNRSFKEFLDWKAASLNMDRRFPDYSIVRKGVVGDWREHFGHEQRSRMEEKTIRMIGHTHLYQDWKKIGCI